MKQIVRGMGTAIAVILLIRLLDCLLAPLLAPLLVLTVLIGLYVLTVRGPGGFSK
jgi:hypothetical protein